MTKKPHIIDILDAKRRGEANRESDIRYLVDAAMYGAIPDYQLSAWLMAVCIRGMTLDEATWLTDSYVKSGDVLDLSDIPGVVVDKHSTGGVGDKTTLILVPLLAAAGLCVAKLSGRGLGFSGGTIDKLESIPGFQVSLSNEAFISQLKTIGMAISSQTSNLAPADGKFYALRDVTATVESVPLIAASVLSKKIAAGARVIVLDIKAGRGAFMKSIEAAEELAKTCREIGARLDRSISTVISSMEMPLGYAIGNSLEVRESIQTLRGEGPPDLEALCLKLGALSLIGAGKVASLPEGEEMLHRHLHDGSALEKFRMLLQSQGGNPAVIEDFDLLPQPACIELLVASDSGYIGDIDPLRVALAAKMLGAGRDTKDSVIDLSVGVHLRKKPGDRVEKGEILGELFVNRKNPEEAAAIMRDAIRIQPEPPPHHPLIHEIVYGLPHEFSHT